MGPIMILEPDATDPTDTATAFAAMCEAIEIGDLATAESLAEDFAIPLHLVWAPEDDFLDDPEPDG